MKFLYLLGIEHPMRFLKGGRAISSVLSKDARLNETFRARFGERFTTVREYYAAHAHLVQIVDVSPWLSELAEDALAGVQTGAGR